MRRKNNDCTKSKVITCGRDNRGSDVRIFFARCYSRCVGRMAHAKTSYGHCVRARKRNSKRSRSISSVSGGGRIVRVRALRTRNQSDGKKATGDPLAFTGKLPAEVNLDVPFTTQAPNSNWDMPYQEACEEASAIMVDGYYRGEHGKIPVDRADKAILDLVAFEKKNYGFYEDTTAEQTAKFIKEAYGYTRVIVKPLTSVEEIKKPLALGYPVIIPFAGKMLGNPNYKNGGPPYHMLVIRGYTGEKFITNDPGTRKGEGYLYDPLTIMNAAHDWTGSKDTVSSGKAYMIVVLPN